MDYRSGLRPVWIICGWILAFLLIVPPRLAHTSVAASQAEVGLPNQPLGGGKAMFESKGCARCHGIWRPQAEGRSGPDLGRTGAWRDLMQFAGALWNHTPQMLELQRKQGIARASLSSDELAELAGYVFFARFIGEPGNVERGKTLFEQRSCARCHQLDGRGGTSGPRLDELKPFMSSFFLAQALWNHGPMMAAKMNELKVARPRFEANDAADLVALLRGEAQSAAPADLAYAQAGNPQAGRNLFLTRGCGKCHAIGGTGGTTGPDLNAMHSAVRVSELIGTLWNHGPSMWAKMEELGIPFPRISDSEMSDLFAYLYYVQYIGQKGNATRGAELFRQKSCVNCHTVGAEGGKRGPNLTALGAPRLPLQWASAMWNHAPAMEKTLRDEQVTWPRFEDDEMRDLVEFLRSPTQGQ